MCIYPKMDLTLDQLILYQLLLRSSMGKEIGLYHGKMGLILFFAHYFRHSGLKVYDDTAGELMDELKKYIHTEMPVGFASGLAGIGWGVEYLIQNGFTEGDKSLKSCRDIDNKIMEKDLRRLTDYSLDAGLEGILHYVLAHIKGVMAQQSVLPFDETYLSDLYQAVTAIPKDVEPSENFKSLSAEYASFYENRVAVNYTLQLLPVIEDDKIEKDRLNGTPLGLKKGLAGYLLKTLIAN